MKITRLRIEQFKRFRQPFELDQLNPGLNLITGPNEAGKSTIACAIRAAFFERHRSASLEHLRPWGDSAACPSVEIDFELNGQAGTLSKSFLGRKRCELRIAGHAWDGVEAEDRLAELLGFGFPGRGASSAEHMGIPGLLWVEQGQSHAITDALDHARNHLRLALGESLGELAASDGDSLLQALEHERGSLLTTATGKPRGEFLECGNRLRTLSEQLQQLDQAIAAYQSAVDRLTGLHAQQRRETLERPWEPLQQQAHAAEKRLRAAQELAHELEQAQQRQQQCATRIDELVAQLAAFEREERALAERSDQLEKATAESQRIERECIALEQQYQACVHAEERNRQFLRSARAASNRRELSARVQDLEQQQSAGRERLKKAQITQQQIAELQAEAARLEMPPKELQRLLALREELRELDLRLNTAATRLDLDLLPGQQLLMDGAPVSGRTQRVLTQAVELDLPGIGQLRITPGGADLEHLNHRHQLQGDSLRAHLQRLGLPSVAVAEQRHASHAVQVQQIQSATAVLAALAPQGVAALSAELEGQQARLQQARTALEGLPPESAEQPELSVAAAESAQRQAQDALEQARTQLDAARLNAARAQARVEQAQWERDAAHELVTDPARAARLQHTQQALMAARQAHTEQEQRNATLRLQLREANLDLLQQDVERWQRSAELSVTGHRDRGIEIARLETELDSKGALGLEEQRAAINAEYQRLERRHAEMQQRTAALDHLLGLLRSHRAELAERIRAPLQQHLQGYLDILLPGCGVEIDANLAPSRLRRSNAIDSGPIDDYSHGAREQMGVIARLAYADLLQAAGRPTLLILDDPLVHSDSLRLEQMKRALYAAATRHQILLFSCHPQAWSGLGVAPRVLEQRLVESGNSNRNAESPE